MPPPFRPCRPRAILMSVRRKRRREAEELVRLRGERHRRPDHDRLRPVAVRRRRDLHRREQGREVEVGGGAHLHGHAAQVLPPRKTDGRIDDPGRRRRGRLKAARPASGGIAAGHELEQVREPVAVRVLLGPLLAAGSPQVGPVRVRRGRARRR